MKKIKLPEERFIVLDYTSIGICVIDDIFTILYWNIMMEDYTGIKSADILGNSLLNHFPHFKEAKYKERIKSIFNSGLPVVFSSQIHKKFFPSVLTKSKKCNQNIHITALPAIDKEHYYAMFSVEDITDISKRLDEQKELYHKALHEIQQREKAEKALKESEKKFRNYIESSGDIMYVVDKNLKFLYGNRKYLERRGLTQKKLLGKEYNDFHSEDGTGKFNERVKAVQESGKSIFYEYQSEIDGRYFLRTLSPIIDPEIKEIESITVISRDVTDRKKVEKKLKQVAKQEKVHSREIERSNKQLKESQEASLNLMEDLSAEIEQHRQTEVMLRASESKIQQSHKQLRRLTAHLQDVREEERTIIARNIHDELGQLATAIKMDISWLQKQLPKENQLWISRTQTISDLVDMTSIEIQRICSELRPGVLDDLGLEDALKWHVSEFEKRTGAVCKLLIEYNLTLINKHMSVAVYRMIQEALTNVQRHAKASKVTISIAGENGKLKLIIKDNGIGIKQEKIDNSSSFGLIGIKERALSMNGYARISGKEGEGTILVIVLGIGNSSL